MTRTKCRGELLIPFDPEFNRTLKIMENQQNPANLGDGEIHQPPLPVEAHNQDQVENQLGKALRILPPSPRPQDYYMGNVKIGGSDVPLSLPPLTLGHTFLVMSSLMQMLNGGVLGTSIRGPSCSHSQTEVSM